MKRKKTGYLFSFFLALMPIFSIYATPIPGVNMAEITLLGCFTILLASPQGTRITLKDQDKKFLVLLAWMTISFLVSALVYEFSISAIIRFIRFSFYYISAMFLGQKWFSKDCFEQAIDSISVVALIYLVIQYLSFYVGGRILLGMIPGLPVYFDNYVAQDYTSLYANFFRPTSFFLEPANFAQFMFMPLVFSLWKKKNIAFAAIITIGIVLSTSGQGIVISVCLWGIYILQQFSRKKISRNQLLTALICFVLGAGLVSIIVQSSVFNQSIGRLLQTGEQSAGYARLSGYLAAANEMTPFSFFFGKGFGNIPQDSWMPGLAYLWYGSGTIGVALLMWYIASTWRNGGAVNRAMVVVFVLTLVESSVFMNIMIIPYMRIMREKWNQGEDVSGKNINAFRRV